jgi:NTP pyrophosphatase (non-canonical NTP hydrolase)
LAAANLPLEAERMQINDFQQMMHRLCFHRDSKRGVKGTYNWLVDEVQELGEALQNNDKLALESEFADVIAWLASLANVTNINLEKAALTKYNSKCPKCQSMPCKCTF